MPGRHSLFWRLAALLVMFCLLVISLSVTWGNWIDLQTAYLSREAHQTLQAYAEEAERAAVQGPQAVDEFLEDVQRREPGLVDLVDDSLQPLGSRPLIEGARLTAMRRLDWPMSRRTRERPLIAIPLSGERGYFIIQLPERYRPWRYRMLFKALTHYLAPAGLALLFCIGLYRVLIAPLARLRELANALHADNLGARVDPGGARRRDELGELGRAFDHMAGRLDESLGLQRQLLRDLSHELRTPLSRLQVASEAGLSGAELEERVRREVGVMRTLVDSTLELAWMDTERPQPPLEPVEVGALWEILGEDACFESGWSPERLPCRLPPDCRVQGHLNGLARALENILRNAIRHSPEGGCVCLDGRRAGDHWLLWVEDQGPGVADSDLERIFRPFTRLNAARPGGDGFGLGLAIARRLVDQQGGRLWAENGHPGLRMMLSLKMYSS
ncbi:sensor histidine kinase [Azotobacter salinestris]|uniref:sensor histidine kinase n=1 Tax=Azotobacter salinestris TaxID=69964 RepID=UPI00126697F8|nr:sensor histidine kinase [Azotobacter salinestris]